MAKNGFMNIVSVTVDQFSKEGSSIFQAYIMNRYQNTHKQQREHMQLNIYRERQRSRLKLEIFNTKFCTEASTPQSKAKICSAPSSRITRHL